MQAWILAANPEEIEAELNVPLDEKKSFLKKESAALRMAQKFIDDPADRYSAIDALRALQTQTTSRAAQLRSVFGTLNPKDLPLDLFYVSSVPGEPGLGFVAKLRALTFIPFDRSFRDAPPSSIVALIIAKTPEVRSAAVRNSRSATRSEPTFAPVIQCVLAKNVIG